MSEPLRTLWDALEAHGCRPHGKAYDFRARCPAHDGDNPQALHVAIGADGRAVLHCFAHGCEVEAVTDALGLRLADLFPNGHKRGQRRPSVPLRRSDFHWPARAAVNALYALERVEQPWRAMVASDCPYCGSQGAWLHVRSVGHVLPNGFCDPQGRAELDCPNGCTVDNYEQALLGRLEEAS